jgi:transcriptional regulator with XRE-family HTH domain
MPETDCERIDEASPEIIAVLKRWGARLRRARLRRHMPEAKLERRAGIQRGTIRMMERAQCDVTLALWLDVLAVLGVDLVTFTRGL